MFCKMDEQLSIYLDSNSTAREAVKFRAKIVHDEDGEIVSGGIDQPVPVPSRVEVCHACSGEGKSSAYLGAFSGRRLEEARADEEFWDDYVSGRHDRPCETCGSHGRIRVPNEASCSDELKKAIAEQDEDDHAAASEQRAEYLMSGGWREEGWYDN